jgi:hypothetical protein
MRLQKHSLKMKGKDYFKYVVIIPSKQIKELGWIEGMNLESIISDGKIILKPSEIKETE